MPGCKAQRRSQYQQET